MNTVELASRILTQLGFYQEPSREIGIDCRRDNIVHLIEEYTHPAKTIKCMVKDCKNHSNEGGFVGDICSPCYQFIAHGKGTNSQAYRNANPAKTLTDEEIKSLIPTTDCYDYDLSQQDFVEFARAILRKASEK